MEEVYDMLDAIRSENVELLTDLLQYDYSFWDNVSEYLNEAIKTGNAVILKVIIKKWHFYKIRDYSNALCAIPYLPLNEYTKLEMIKVLLQKFNPEDPNWPDWYPVSYLLEVIICCCTEKNFYLVEFFITHFYSAKYNNLYPLIKKLETAFDGWHHICILLHDGIDYSTYFTIMKHSLKNEHIQNVSETFLQLLKKRTRESMDLTVLAFQGLVSIDCLPHFGYFLRFGAMLDVEETLNDPLITKLSFKLIYNSINDKTLRNIYKCIDSWVRTYWDGFTNPKRRNRFAMQALNPFIQKPLQKLIPEHNQTSSEQNGNFSLQKLSQDVIRCKVYQKANNVKEYMDGIWSLNLPTTVKCLLLHIPDSSWMDN